MYSALAALVRPLDRGLLDDHAVIPWAAPVPFFGPLGQARVATVGINPSNREFLDDQGQELLGQASRLPTLRSLAIASWGAADHDSLRHIATACSEYFFNNPYDRWFGILERVLRTSDVTMYGAEANACHLDLVPYATATKWGSLESSSRRVLSGLGAAALGELLAASSISTLLLNGASVVSLMASVISSSFQSVRATGWDLPRPAGRPVTGMAYFATVDEIGGVYLGRPMRLLGWNHNLQSSFGVTRGAVEAIATWLTQERIVE